MNGRIRNRATEIKLVTDEVGLEVGDVERAVKSGVTGLRSEKAYWKDQAALLDPGAYTLYEGDSFSVTVPAGETWFAINLWHVVVGSTYIFQRVCDINRPVILPAGTTIAADGSQFALAYICKPSEVEGDSTWYSANPRKLYYDRLESLKELTLHSLAVTIDSGEIWGTIESTAFPTDFDDGLVVLASAHDVAWLTLDSGTAGMNLQNEISDDHQMRFAEAIMVPFQRATFANIKARAANVSGDTNDFSSMAGKAAVYYFKLPADW